MSAFVVSIHSAGAQGEAVSGLYQIVSGTYTECCGIVAVPNRESLPNEYQRFVRLTVDPQTDLATMTFLSADSQTIRKVDGCRNPIDLSFDFGSVRSNSIVFHIDPSPMTLWAYWDYAVSNSTDRLQIDGTLGVAQGSCPDAFTRYTHSNVVAVLVQPPTLKVTEFTKEGASLFIRGTAGWTNVVEVSTNLVSWAPISTNLMPNTLCPVCPSILFHDAASTNFTRRYYRCFEIP
jgi:hypothetical protein